ncbi:general stress protein [Ruania alba]|uniref:General stress protein 17M-like domain-containing protein n=1 Tax=Ruania alba TaxID=648782 RepID=A0A1H5CTE9_9MICO|nr:general stress protein [Ruania alba]SED69893.1 hypothetical protein SAMN04488554_0465 [Ruania alba]
MPAMSPTDPRAGNQPRGEEIATYSSYLEAQRAVDYLADEEFAVSAVTIVGKDLTMVERITGRRTYPKVALRGAGSGAYFGFFIGILLLLFGGTLAQTLLPALLIGAGAGMLFAVIAYAMTGGKRDFTSTSQVVAGSFAILCLEEKAGEARRVLNGLGSDGQSGGPGAPVTQVARPSEEPQPPAQHPPVEQQPAQQPPAQQPSPQQPPAHQPPHEDRPPQQ